MSKEPADHSPKKGVYKTGVDNGAGSDAFPQDPGGFDGNPQPGSDVAFSSGSSTPEESATGSEMAKPGGLFRSDSDTNWGASVWLIVLCFAAAGFLYVEFNRSRDAEFELTLLDVVYRMQLQSRDIAHRSLSVPFGHETEFEQLSALEDQVDSEIKTLFEGSKKGVGVSQTESYLRVLANIDRVWKGIVPELDFLHKNGMVPRSEADDIERINEFISQITQSADDIAARLVSSSGGEKLVWQVSHLKLLAEKVRSGMNVFFNGMPGWDRSIAEVMDGSAEFRQVLSMVTKQNGSAAASQLRSLASLADQLFDANEAVLIGAQDRLTLLNSSDRIAENAMILSQQLALLETEIRIFTPTDGINGWVHEKTDSLGVGCFVGGITFFPWLVNDSLPA